MKITDIREHGWRCTDCDKLTFRTRRAAREFARRRNHCVGQRAYRCPAGNGYHLTSSTARHKAYKRRTGNA